MKKTTRKEIIEEYDESGKIRSRTTIEETEEETPDAESSYDWLREYWTAASTAPIASVTTTNTYDPDQITIEQFFRGE